VVSHANIEGRLKVQLEWGAADYTDYEDLKDAVTSKKLVIDTSLLLPRPIDAGVPLPAKMIFWGCLIGRVPLYMKKMKEALGNQVTVAAPLYDHIGAELLSPSGAVEYMGYKFEASSLKQLKDKKAAIAAFIPSAEPRIDNNPVPPKLWDEWVPNNPNAPSKPDEWIEIPNNVNLPNIGVGKKVSVNAPRKFKYYARKLFGLGTGPIPLSKDPGTEAGYKKAMKDYLIQNVRSFMDKDFPMYVRLGYKSMDDFMDGWNWHFKYDKKTDGLSFAPDRHQYMMIQPITDLATGELIANFFPTGKKGTVTELIKDTDPRFFATF
jgi:hypothetical protein